MVEITVKPLEWETPVSGDIMRRAETIVGMYRAWTFHGANGKWFWNRTFGNLTESNNPPCSSLDEAKAAVQADYEARVRSALVATEAPVAWRWRPKGTNVWILTDRNMADSPNINLIEQEPLYASPPSPKPETGDMARDVFTSLREANIARQAAWCPDQVPDLSFRGNELAGETGEVCNVIKKLERERLGWRGSRDTLEHLAEELADVVICADLVALSAGIDLNASVIAKFNATSEKVGLPHRLRAAPPDTKVGGDDE